MTGVPSVSSLENADDESVQSETIGGRLREGIETLLSRVRTRRIRPTDPPLRFTDDRGRSVLIRPYSDDDFDNLVEMYDDFDSGLRAQGVPPIGTQAIREWLDDLAEGVNAVAIVDNRPIGQVSFVPDGTGRHELAIFVHQDYQKAGIGSQLLAVGMGHAGQQDVEYVWLSVERNKGHLLRLYSRAGFSAVNPLGFTPRMSRYL